MILISALTKKALSLCKLYSEQKTNSKEHGEKCSDSEGACNRTTCKWYNDRVLSHPEDAILVRED